MDGCWPGCALTCDIVRGAVWSGDTPTSIWREHNGLLAVPPIRKGMNNLIEGALGGAVFSSWSMLSASMQSILSTASLTNQEFPMKI